MSKLLFFINLFLVLAITTRAQDSTTVIFETTPLDSALVYIEADNYNFSDTLWVKHGDTRRYRSGFVIFTLTSPSFRDTKDFAVLKPNQARTVKLDTTLAFNSRKQLWNASSFIPLSRDANVLVMSEQESNVFVNGKKVGSGSLLLKLPENTSYTIVTQGAHGSKKDDIRLHSYNKYEGLDHYTIPSTTSVRLNALLPGSFDLQRRNFGLGFAYIGSIVGLSALIITQTMEYRVNERKTVTWESEYISAGSETAALEASEQYNKYRNAANINVRNQRLSITGIVGIFAFNYYRIHKLQKSRLGNPNTIDFMSLPRFEYNASTGTFMGGVSASF